MASAAPPLLRARKLPSHLQARAVVIEITAASKVATGMELAGPAAAARATYIKALRESLFPRKRA
eukprot:10581995-Alexandrium_andersonii.AAC.1